MYKTELPTSTCSDILSTKWAFLDDKELSKYECNVQKDRKPYWSTLEAALIEWQIRYNLYPNSGLTTSALLRLKATEFQEKLLEYNSLLCLKQTKRQLFGFKKRHSLKERQRYSKAKSTQLNKESKATIKEIKKASKEYNAKDIYNIDKTSYYQKIKLNQSLSTFKTSKKKIDKTQITIA